MDIFKVINGGMNEDAPIWSERDHYTAGKIVGQAMNLRYLLRTGRSLPLPDPERESLILALSQFIETTESQSWT